MSDEQTMKFSHLIHINCKLAPADEKTWIVSVVRAIGETTALSCCW